MILSFNDYKSEELYSSRYTPAVADRYLTSHCLYCGSPLKREDKVINILWGDPRKPHPSGQPSATSDSPRRILLRCLECGWWLVLWSTQEKEYPSGSRRYAIEHYWALLRKFNLNSLEIPLSELRAYLSTHPDKIYNMNYKQFGRLMNDCFSNTLHCSVEYLDGPNDGGIDANLYLVESPDSPYLIQYKARQSPRPSESVSVVREVLGAMIVNGRRNGIVLTTREKWSYQAIAEVQKETLRQQGFYVELYDCSRVIDLIAQAAVDDREPWTDVFDPIVLRPDFLRETMEEERKRKREKNVD